MSNVTINLEIFDDSIGDEWNDVEAAAAAYADFLENRLIRELSDSGIAADVSVDYKPNMAGCAATSIIADDHEIEAQAEAIVERESDLAWGYFCGSDAAATL